MKTYLVVGLSLVRVVREETHCEYVKRVIVRCESKLRGVLGTGWMDVALYT